MAFMSQTNAVTPNSLAPKNAPLKNFASSCVIFADRKKLGGSDNCIFSFLNLVPYEI